MSTSVREHLRGTIAHLYSRREGLQVEIEQINHLLRALNREEQALPQTPNLPFPQDRGEYAGMSIRWAILRYFSEHADGPQTLGIIADTLRAGGSTSKAQSFNSNISAVLSQMVGKDELAKAEDGFSITQHGRDVWQGIRNSEKYLIRTSDEARDE